MKDFKPNFSRGFIPAGLCDRCGKVVGTHGQHQFLVGLLFCVRKSIQQKKEAK
jgi:hypothetical protein